MSFRHEWNGKVDNYLFYLIDHQGNETFIAEGCGDRPDPGDNGFDYDMWLHVVDCYPTIGNVYNTMFVFHFGCDTVKMVQHLNCVGNVSQQIITTFYNGIDRNGAIKDLIDYCQETFKKDHKAFEYRF